MRVSQLTPVFVEYVPEAILEGALYVSMQYGTAVHKCCCGCGCEVVTPMSPTDWRLIFDGEHVSLEPSIGNWSFPCRSHYVISRGRVRWAADWTDAEVVAGRQRTLRERGATTPGDVETTSPEKRSWWQRVRRAVHELLSAR
jgi:hypothetical protein